MSISPVVQRFLDAVTAGEFYPWYRTDRAPGRISWKESIYTTEIYVDFLPTFFGSTPDFYLRESRDSLPLTRGEKKAINKIYPTVLTAYKQQYKELVTRNKS